MYKHEDKTCPRCRAVFECKLGDITKCQCYAVKLNDAASDFLARNYTDCLCAGCMQAVSAAYNQAQQEMQVKQAFGLR